MIDDRTSRKGHSNSYNYIPYIQIVEESMSILRREMEDIKKASNKTSRD